MIMQIYILDIGIKRIETQNYILILLQFYLDYFFDLTETGGKKQHKSAAVHRDVLCICSCCKFIILFKA